MRSGDMSPYVQTQIDLENLGPEFLSNEFWDPLFGLHSLISLHNSKDNDVLNMIACWSHL